MGRRILIARRRCKNVGAPAHSNDPQINLGEVQLYKELLNLLNWCFSQNNQEEEEEEEEEEEKEEEEEEEEEEGEEEEEREEEEEEEVDEDEEKELELDAQFLILRLILFLCIVAGNQIITSAIATACYSIL